jgi:dipeptidyl aminopeptidase/acylaminoacyl peptidase
MTSQILWLIGAALTIMMSLTTSTANHIPHIEARIVYSGEDSLYTRTLDKNSPRTRLGIQGDNPRWSPDGTKIVFHNSPDGVSSDIYVANADGTGLRQLTDARDIDASPIWSPDGTQIVFESWRDGDPNIYLMDADGSHLIRLTDDPEVDQWPVWSPDGSQIAFQSNRDGNVNIYVMSSNGTNLKQLTSYSGFAVFPHWTLDMKVAFSQCDESYNCGLYILDIDNLRVSQIPMETTEFHNFVWLSDGNAIYGSLLNLIYLNASTGVSTRISEWWPYEMNGGYDIWVESIVPTRIAING